MDLWVWLLFLPVVWWAGAITACAIKPDTNLLQILQVLTEKLDQPFSISYTPYTLRCMFTFTIAYVLGIGIYYSQKRNYRRGVEHGSAKWGDAASICKRYRDKRYTQNLILTQNFRMGLDCYQHKRNLNVLVVGGSGAGKSRAYAVVNIMQCNCSMVVTDPKGELLRKTGGLLEREGYEVRVFDLINPETSFCYNPFAYVRDDKDVLKLINNLIRNTTPKGAQSSDPFWEKSETALLQALMLYLLHEAPPEEQNFSIIMEMLGSAQVKEDDEEYQSPLDILFERLEMRNPESIAVKQYAIYKQAAGMGGSGAGKSRAYAVVNIMQCNCSMVVTDPKGELLRKTGGLLEREGYEVRVFDLINPETSFCYNPFAYVRDDKDVLKLINNLIRNTTPKGAQSSDPFWEKSETALLQALMLYLLHEAPPEEQNFSIIMEMLGSAQVKEDDEEYQSPLDILFERLEMRNPESIAVKQYAIYKQAAGKTAKSILISVGVRLAAFNLKQIANLTCTDELDLYSIGEKKVALFCCIPDADTSLNYLVGMIYSNLFQTLYYVADRKYHGKLPIPVHCIMDEWPNVALPDDFDKLLATMRSRAISCSIIIQNIAQMKALFKDSWESLIGNCDEFLYLGGNEKEGHKYVSELLGKETLDTNTYGQTKGRSGSYSVNFQQSGRELLTPDEVRLLDNRKAVLLVRGEHPILDEKYDLHKHVNVKYTEDGGAPPYDYAKAPLSHEDVTIDTRRLDDYELLSAEEILGGEQSF